MITLERTYELGTLRIEADGPKLYFSNDEHSRLIKKAKKFLAAANYRPDWVVTFTNGGAFIAPIIARCFGLNPVYWSACGYEARNFTAGGTRRKATTLAETTSWVSPDGTQRKLPGQLTGRVLLVDDLIDSKETLNRASAELHKQYGDGFTIKTLCLWRKLYPDRPVPDVDFVTMDVRPEPTTKQVPWIVQWHERLVEELLADHT